MIQLCCLNDSPEPLTVLFDFRMRLMGYMISVGTELQRRDVLRTDEKQNIWY